MHTYEPCPKTATRYAHRPPLFLFLCDEHANAISLETLPIAQAGTTREPQDEIERFLVGAAMTLGYTVFQARQDAQYIVALFHLPTCNYDKHALREENAKGAEYNEGLALADVASLRARLAGPCPVPASSAAGPGGGMSPERCRYTVADAVYTTTPRRSQTMRSLRDWTQAFLAEAFLFGIVVGFVCGSLVTVGAAVWWLQDRAIVRAAALPPYQRAHMDEGHEASEWIETTRFGEVSISPSAMTYRSGAEAVVRLPDTRPLRVSSSDLLSP